MPEYDGSIRINTKIEIKQAEKELKSFESNISKSADKIASLRSKMDSLKDVKIPTEEYKTIQTQIDNTEKKIIDLQARQEKFLATGGKESSSTYQRMQYDIDELKASLPYLKSELQSLVESGKAFTLGSDTEKYAEMAAQIQQLNQQMESDAQRQSELQSSLAAEEERLAQIKANATVSDQQIIDLLERRKQLIAEIKDMEAAGVGLGYKQYEDANHELEEVNGKIKDYRKNLGSVPEKFEKMRKSANKAFNAVASGTKKNSGLLSTFSSRLKGIALSLLVFNWISKGFNAMISGMKKGFENLAGYSDSYAQSVQNMKNAMSTLGNQFAAAFAPIVQMVIPWLNSLINALTKAMTYVAQFIAVLGGKSTFTKAKKVQDDYNKSLGGTAKAADKARGALAKFDDLDVLEKQDDTGSGGATETLPEDMFEEIPVDKKAVSWLDNILAKVKELKAIFAQGFWDGLGDWEYRWQDIKDSISSIKDSLIDIWTDSAVLSASKNWFDSVAYMLGSIVSFLASIGLTIATNLIGGIANYIDQNEGRIKEHLIEMFNIQADIANMFSELFQSIAYIFEAFASENGQQLTANIIGMFADAFMGARELVSKAARDSLNIFIQPFMENKEEFRTALEGFLGVLSEIAGTIKDGIDQTFDKLNEVYDEHIKPFFDSIASGLSDTAEKFMEFWNNDVQPILDKWAAKFDEVWQEYIQPTLDKFIDLFGKVADLLKAVWENVLKPLIDWIIENVLPVILPIIEGIGDAFLIVFGTISEVVGGIIDVIGGIIDFLTGVFSGDWEKAWDGVVGIFDGIAGVIGGIIDGIIGVIKTVIDAINGAIQKIKEFLSEKAKASATGPVGGAFSSMSGTSSNAAYSARAISGYSVKDLPHLATGSVIRGGNPFMAILGDQPAGQVNIEAPLDTIKQAVREELSGINLGNTGAMQAKVVLNINGVDVGEAMLDDLFSVMSRRGYDVSVLGVR